MNAPDFKPDPTLFPFESKWFESSVGRIHYIDEGSGTPIILFHGQPTWSFLYRKIVERLADGFRCIAPDYPGFGLSVRPAEYQYTPAEHATVIGELVDALELDGFLIMGQDWGGPIGLSIAGDRSEQVKGLVLGNTWFWPVSLSARIFSTIMSTGFMQHQIVEKNFFVEKIMPFAMKKKLTEDEFDHYRKAQPTPELRTGLGEFPRQLTRSESFLENLEKRVLSQLASKPTLLTWGMGDMAFRPRQYIPQLRMRMPQAEVVELRRAKHYIQEDAPDEIAGAIRGKFG
ncbi:MAG: alpha/beta fold hydrolase [Actinobacteria bacterium]|nr:alpha/beta fold hydrolase [Actinomycetota bacterium]